MIANRTILLLLLATLGAAAAHGDDVKIDWLATPSAHTYELEIRRGSVVAISRSSWTLQRMSERAGLIEMRGRIFSDSNGA